MRYNDTILLDWLLANTQITTTMTQTSIKDRSDINAIISGLEFDEAVRDKQWDKAREVQQAYREERRCDH